MITYGITRPQWVKIWYFNLFISWFDVLWYGLQYSNDLSRACNNGLVQERRNSIANALELRLSCTNPSTSDIEKRIIKHNLDLTLTSEPWDICTKADSRFVPSQGEKAFLCNDISHWLGASLESALCNEHFWKNCHVMTRSYNILQCIFHYVEDAIISLIQHIPITIRSKHGLVYKSTMAWIQQSEFTSTKDTP